MINTKCPCEKNISCHNTHHDSTNDNNIKRHQIISHWSNKCHYVTALSRFLECKNHWWACFVEMLVEWHDKHIFRPQSTDDNATMKPLPKSPPSPVRVDQEVSCAVGIEHQTHQLLYSKYFWKKSSVAPDFWSRESHKHKNSKKYILARLTTPQTPANQQI